MKWVVAALVVVLMAGAGIWFATSVGWDDSIPAGTFRYQATPGACDRILVAGRVWLPASEVSANGWFTSGAPPVGKRVLVHHQWFHSPTYTLMADDGTRVPLSQVMICSAH